MLSSNTSFSYSCWHKCQQKQNWGCVYFSSEVCLGCCLTVSEGNSSINSSAYLRQKHCIPEATSREGVNYRFFALPSLFDTDENSTSQTPTPLWKLIKEIETQHHVIVKLTSPAPWKTKVFSDSFLPVMRREAKIPATATAAVPENEETWGISHACCHGSC